MPDEQQGQGEGGTGTQGGSTPGGAPAGSPRPSGDLDWRARALKAEARAEELEKLAAELARKLEEAQSSAAALDRKRRVEDALSAHGAIDLETASMLIDAAIAGATGDGAPDIATAVTDLRRRKPFLFGASTRASAMSGVPGAPLTDTLGAAADEARATGDRNALLRYLRMKRS